MESWREELYLAHYGIKGQRWGVRRGPPYPIGSKSGSGKSSGTGRKTRTKTLDKSAGKLYTVKRSSNLAKAAKIGAVAALAGLAVYGAYRAGYLDDAAKVGRKALNRAMEQVGKQNVAGNMGGFTPPSNPAPKPKKAPIIRDPKTGFRIINESVEDSLRNANPLHGSSEGSNNCTYCSVAGILRIMGYDVTAKSTGGKKQNLGGVVEDCFKNAKVYSGSAVKFSKSPEDAAAMLKKRFGDNAAGVCGIDFKGTQGGHAFSWIIKDGNVNFLDFQQRTSGEELRSYWSMIDPVGDLTFARIDNLEINLDSVSKYVNVL